MRLGRAPVVGWKHWELALLYTSKNSPSEVSPKFGRSSGGCRSSDAEIVRHLDILSECRAKLHFLNSDTTEPRPKGGSHKVSRITQGIGGRKTTLKKLETTSVTCSYNIAIRANIFYYSNQLHLCIFQSIDYC